MIYVLGSINMDLVAGVPYMPRRGETLSSTSFYVNPGGKGANQAVAIGKLGGKVAMIGKVGGDSYGKACRAALQGYNVDVTHVTEEGASTGVAIILVENGDNRIILDGGANNVWTESDVDEGLKAAKAGDILLLQLEVPLAIVQYALEIAKNKGMTTVLNPAPAVSLPESVLARVDIITPNETETEILTGIAPVDVVHATLAVKKFYEYGIRHVIITMGGKGAVVSAGSSITEIPPRKVKVVDTTGAGDTFVGAVCVKLTEGFDIVDACFFASCASGITITRKGAAQSIPTLAEADEVYKTLPARKKQ